MISTATSCEYRNSHRIGWRVRCFHIGAVLILTHRGSITFLMFVARFIIFDLQESSKYLIAKGRDEEALAVSLVFLVFDGLPLSSTACRVW